MPGRTKGEPNLSREIQSKIGQQLRTLFDEVVGQGVPDRFVDLLGRLDRRDDKK
jgi:anti-sigma factor NepR-like protein